MALMVSGLMLSRLRGMVGVGLCVLLAVAALALSLIGIRTEASLAAAPAVAPATPLGPKMAGIDANVAWSTDDQMLDDIEKRAFAYFWEQTNPETGLTRDRSTNTSPASIAATGFALTAYPIGEFRGWVTREQAYSRTLATLRFFKEKMFHKNGFYYHFVDPRTGSRTGNSEVSSIDTALFLNGVLFAMEYYNGTEVEALSRAIFEWVDWQWMRNDTPYLAMAWFPDGFGSAQWKHYNELMGMLIMAIGAQDPFKALPKNAWSIWARPVRKGPGGDYIYCPCGEPLFVYQYAHAWIDFRDKHDAYADYWKNSAEAIANNRAFTQANRTQYQSYQDDRIWGLSASDAPGGGYRAYGPADGHHDGTIAPYASLGSMPWVPQEAKAAARAMREKYGDKIWGRYGFTSAFNVDQNWWSSQYIGIDVGTILLMIENYRTGFVWKHFMKNQYIQDGMRAAGFKDEKVDWTVSPTYLQLLRKNQTGSGRPQGRQAASILMRRGVRVDGDLGDWSKAEWQQVNENDLVPGVGPAPDGLRLRAKFAASWDLDYLYLAADVEDPVLVSNIAPNDLQAFYRTDSVELYLEPGAFLGNDLGLFKLAILPFDTEGHPQAVRHEDAQPGPITKSAPGTLVASKRTSGGYAIEVAIPWKHLGIAGPVKGLQLGYTFTVHNADDAKAAPGAYVRNAMLSWTNVAEVWARNASWGSLELK